MKKKYLTCIVCPMGCSLEISVEEGQKVDVSGYSCKKGLDYGQTESTNPVRTLTTTVRVEGGLVPVVPVRSDRPLPKHLIFDCMKVINGIRLTAPVKMGSRVVENILGTGVNIITTKEA